MAYIIYKSKVKSEKSRMALPSMLVLAGIGLSVYYVYVLPLLVSFVESVMKTIQIML